MKIKQKHIDAAREVRLWVSQVILPSLGIATFVSPELREKIRNGIVRMDIFKAFKM